MGEMSPKEHVKVPFTLVQLISMKSANYFKTDENNIPWLSNWLIVSFSDSEPCNPKIASHFFN